MTSVQPQASVTTGKKIAHTYNASDLNDGSVSSTGVHMSTNKLILREDVRKNISDSETIKTRNKADADVDSAGTAIGASGDAFSAGQRQRKPLRDLEDADIRATSYCVQLTQT